jgi:hypothetical protein
MTMTTVPVEVQEPICESDLEKIYDIPGSILYRSEVTLPDGTTRVFESVRAYADQVDVNANGHVSLNIVSKSDRIYSGLIPFPYHYLHKDEWMCALKIHKMDLMSDDNQLTFAMNYNLFCLPWKLAVILHGTVQDTQVFLASREEWERGEVSVKNREVQMFLSISKERSVPVKLFKLGLDSGMQGWINHAVSAAARKQ